VRALALAGALASLVVALFIARPPSTPGVAMRDFESYYAAGATWDADEDPYGRAIWQTERSIPGVVASRNEVLPFVGSPFALPLWGALARLDYGHACLVWGIVLALCALTIVLGALWLAGGSLRGPEATAVLALGVGFGPLTSGLALGQTAIVACAGLVLVTIALRAREPLRAWLAAIAAALQPNLALALVTLFDRRSRWMLFGSAVLAVGIVSTLALGGIAPVCHYATLLSAHADAERFLAIQVTPAAAFRALGLLPALAMAAGLLIALLVALRTLSVVRALGDDQAARLAVGCAALPLVNPFAHEHDLTVALIASVIALRRLRGRLWVVAAAATLLVAVDWLALAQRPTALAQRIALALAASLAIVALRPEPVRRVHFFFGASALGVAVLGLYAAHDPLPIWPDALSSLHPAGMLSISALWALEQQRSGIAALHPLWGALRLISLCGCAVLWQACAAGLGALPDTNRPAPTRSQATAALWA